MSADRSPNRGEFGHAMGMAHRTSSIPAEHDVLVLRPEAIHAIPHRGTADLPAAPESGVELRDELLARRQIARAKGLAFLVIAAERYTTAAAQYEDAVGAAFAARDRMTETADAIARVLRELEELSR